MIHQQQQTQILLLSLVIFGIFAKTANGFVEDFRIDPQYLPRPQRVPDPEPEPLELNLGYLHPNCEHICRNAHTCKNLIQMLSDDQFINYDHNVCESDSLLIQQCVANQQYHPTTVTKTSSSSYRQQYRRYYRHMLINGRQSNIKYGQCPIRLDQCPQGYLPSGFGSDEQLRKRCIPLQQCKYLYQIRKHVNEIHDGIDWC